MNLTPELKAEIDSKSYTELLRRWRHTPCGDTMFQGESGKYWGERLAELRNTVDHVAISKEIG